MMILPNWLTAYASVRVPGTLIVAKRTRDGGAVLVLRVSGVDCTIPCVGVNRTREIFERTVEAHERGEL